MKKEFKTQSEDIGMRLDRWFKNNQPQITHILLQKMLRKKDVKVNGKRAEANYRLQKGDEISFFAPELDQKPRKTPQSPKNIDQKHIKNFQSWVVYEDKDYIIINKPHGMPSQGGSGITISIDHIIREISERYKLVHRLDKDTSGVLVIAKKTTAARKFGELLQAKEIEKIYHALVRGVPTKRQGKITLPLLKKGLKVEKMEVDDNGKSAITEFRVLEAMGKEFAWLELKPITGRTHQLRVHCAEIGHPIIGDGKYGGSNAFEDEFSNKLHLHAKQIIIPELEINVEADLPPHMKGIS